MATYQVTMFFNAQTQGWTETWYCTGSTFSSVAIGVTLVAKARALCLAPQVAFEGVRYSDITIKGDSFFDTSPFTYTQQTEARDIPQAAMLMRLEAGTLYRRLFLMRGQPDDWLVWNPAQGIMIRSDVGRPFTNAFLSSLVANSMQLRVISKAPDDVATSQVTAISLDPSSPNTKITIAPGFVLDPTRNPPDKVRFTGFTKILKLLNGSTGNYTQISSTNIVVPVIFSALTGFDSTMFTKARALRQKLIFTNITDTAFEDARSRQTGRALFVPAGRRKRR